MSSVSDLRLEDSLGQGVMLYHIQPGGKDGPNDVVLNSDQLGGGLWTEQWVLGYPTDPWRLSIPDIRMGRNQFWPMHWHDCWIAVVVLDGTVMIGDWWMSRGDVLISPATVEYGPVFNGPKGCQLLEIFAKDILAPGGYAQEYHDHPTLSYLQSAKSGAGANFQARPKGAEVNAGNQITPLAGVPGLKSGHLSGGTRWDLGEADDPDRAVLLDSKMRAGDTYPAHWYNDWRGFLVLDGSILLSDREIGRDDLVIVEPRNELPSFTVGADGVHLLEVARTTAGVPRIFPEKSRNDPAFADVLSRIDEKEFESAR